MNLKYKLGFIYKWYYGLKERGEPENLWEYTVLLQQNPTNIVASDEAEKRGFPAKKIWNSTKEFFYGIRTKFKRFYFGS